MLIALRIAHWLVITYAWVLAGRAVLDAVVFYNPRVRDRLLALETVLSAFTEPLLEPIRRSLGFILPAGVDFTPFVGVFLCLVIDFVIAFLSAHL